MTLDELLVLHVHILLMLLIIDCACRKTGLLVFGPKDGLFLNKTIKTVSENDVEHEVLTAEEVTNKCNPFHLLSLLFLCEIWLDLFSLCCTGHA